METRYRIQTEAGCDDEEMTSLLQNGYYLYSVSAFEYFNRAHEKIAASKTHRHYLFYAALETRFLIETILREYLVTLKDFGSSRAASDHYRPTSVIKEIEAAEPYFADKVHFANVLLQASEVANQLPIPDLQLFRSYYEALHKYLHTQHLPTYLVESDWWQHFEEELAGMLEFARPFLQMPKVRLTCNDSGLKLFHRFRRGELSAESLLEIARNNLFNDAEIELRFRQFPQE